MWPDVILRESNEEDEPLPPHDIRWEVGYFPHDDRVILLKWDNTPGADWCNVGHFNQNWVIV